jgi:hypothetical protein
MKKSSPLMDFIAPDETSISNRWCILSMLMSNIIECCAAR